MEKELEDVLNKLYNQSRMKELIALTNGNKGEKKEELVVTIYDGVKCAEFHNGFIQKARSMRELKPLLDYLNNHGYKTNLD